MLALRPVLLGCLFVVAAQPQSPTVQSDELEQSSFMLGPRNAAGERYYRLRAPLDVLGIAVIGPAALDITITAPDGVSLTLDAIKQRGGSVIESVQEGGNEADFFPGDYLYEIRLPSPELGLYRLRATAKTALSEEGRVFILPLPEGDTEFALRPAPEIQVEYDYIHDAAFVSVPLTVTATVLSRAAPVSGVRVHYRFVEAGDPRTVELLDDGRGADGKAADGVYSATFTPTKEGTLEIYASTTLPESLPQGPHEQAWTIAVEPAMARLLGEPAMVPLDEDGDGRFETLAIETEVEVIEEGEYGWTVFIDYPGRFQGHPHIAISDTRRLAPGRHRLAARTPLVGGLPANAEAWVIVPSAEYPIPALLNPRRVLRGQLWRQNPSQPRPLAPLPSERRARMTQKELEAHEEAAKRAEEFNRQRVHPVLLQVREGLGTTPDLDARSLATPSVRLTGPAKVEAEDGDGDGDLDRLVFSAPLQLGTGVTLKSASLKVGSSFTVFSEVIDSADIHEIRIRILGRKLIENQVDGSVPLRLRLETSHGAVSYSRVAFTPPLPHTRFTSPGPRILSITPSEGEVGQTLQVVVRTRNLQIQPTSGGSLHRRGADGVLREVPMPLIANARVVIEDIPATTQGPAGEDAFYAEIWIPDRTEPGPRTVEVTSNGLKAVLPDGFTVLPFAARFTGGGRAFPLDSDGDGVPDRVAWEFDVESRRAVEVTGHLKLAGGLKVESRDFSIPAGASRIRFVGAPDRLWDKGYPPAAIESVILRVKPYRAVAKLERPTIRVDVDRADFLSVEYSIGGEITSRAVDDDGNGLFDRVVFRVPLDMQAEHSLSQGRVTMRVVSADGKMTAQAHGKLDRFEVGRNVVEVALAGVEVSGAAVTGPLKVSSIAVNANNVGQTTLPVAVTTAVYEAAQFEAAQPQLRRVRRSGRGEEHWPRGGCGVPAPTFVWFQFPNLSPRGLFL